MRLPIKENETLIVGGRRIFLGADMSSPLDHTRYGKIIFMYLNANDDLVIHVKESDGSVFIVTMQNVQIVRVYYGS